MEKKAENVNKWELPLEIKSQNIRCGGELLRRRL